MNDKMEITECEGYKKLLASVEKDETRRPGDHDYRGKLAWVLERAKHYAEITGLEASDILDAWEKERGYWYMNYYQDSQQPPLTNKDVRIFDAQIDFENSVGKAGFRCPMCEGISRSPYECTSGKEMRKGVICDWKSYGLFTTLDKGVFVFFKDAMRGQNIFMPIEWEKEGESA